MLTFDNHNHHLQYAYTDGGRAAAGFDKAAIMGDCVTRATSIATGDGYAATHRSLSKISLFLNADCGVFALLFMVYLRLKGFRRVKDKNLDLKDERFQDGTYLVLAKLTGRKVLGFLNMGHAFAVIDGVVRDTMGVRFAAHKIVAVYKKAK